MKEYHKTSWENLYKITIANPDDSMQHHEVVKLLLVMKLLKKHSHEKQHIRIYTEFPAVKGKISDVYYENLRTKEAHAFEVQKNVTEKWLMETEGLYEKWDSMIFDTVDWHLIDLTLLSNDIKELNSQLDTFLV